MGRLKAAISREYEDEPNAPILHNPKNTQTVKLHFRGEKVAKIMGTLAIDSPKSERHLSGVLVKRNFNYHLVAPSDLNKYTDLVMSTINQKLSVHYAGTFDDLQILLAGFGFKELESKKKRLITEQDIKLDLNTEDKLVIL